jgi:hypothetical protein
MTAPIFNDVAVVGMHFRGQDIKSMVANFVPPLSLDLEREPDNQYDEFAVKVLYNGEHIGYIESANGGAAPFLAAQLDDGQKYHCTVEYMEQRGRNIHPICTLTPEES